MIPPSVKQEVLVDNKPGYFVIENAIKEGWIKVMTPKNNPDFGLGSGENSVINLAKERKETIIMDDAFAMKVANVFNIRAIRTTSIIFLAVKKGIINKQKAVSLLNKIIEVGYYISPKEYSILLNKLKE